MADLYDGFISYSHAADDLLAPRLQAGLQRFAKPWWKRRAVRIFRDESSLSANPHLWSSITEALDTSGWFVLLLSPDAASSEWVNQEISYWVEHRDAGRILPILTDGEFDWADGDVTGDAIPEALRGVFEAEPRWVDLRWAKGEEQLDLQDPRFADAVADIASTIRGIPKDDLASEEVRQHRRTVRTAWAAGIVTAALAVAAVGFGVSSGRNAQEAERLAQAESEARAEAETNRAAEAEARAEAEQSANAALTAQTEAEEEAARADETARRLLDFVVDIEGSEVEPPPPNPIATNIPLLDFRLAVDPPASVRLDFLQDHCNSETCLRIAGFIDPERRLRTTRPTNIFGIKGGTREGSGWLAHEPFHLRHGFPVPVGSDPSDLVTQGFEVVLYVRKVAGPADRIYDFEETYLTFAQEVLVEGSSSCGPGHRDMEEAVSCLRWVFQFPDGLTPGRYDLWVEWNAPCAAWFETDICISPSRPINLFNSGVTMNFYDETYLADSGGGRVPWPFDPWAAAEPIPGDF